MDFRVEVRTLSQVYPHPHADRLDVGRIGGYRTVLVRGRHRAGERVLYVPEGAVLPGTLIEAMGLTGRLAGRAKNRVKAVRLRGLLSEGIVHPLDDGRVRDPEGTSWPAVPGEDYAERLGIVKHEPEVPVSMKGEAEPCTPRLPGYDVQAWKNDPAQIPPGTPCVALEKLHGTCCVAGFAPSGRVSVASKGIAAKGFRFAQGVRNVYTEALAPHVKGLRDEARNAFPDAPIACWVGEVCGPRVQDLAYGLAARRLFVFELGAYDEDERRWRWLDWDRVTARAKAAGVDTPPEVERLDAPDADAQGLARAEALAAGPSLVPGAAHLREGVVLRARSEAPSTDGDRQVRKIVSGDYLVRHKGTERR